MSARRAIVVLGPHRCGTSVVARALQGAGVNLGKQLLEPNEDNPKGFFENAQIVAFNDRLLKHLGMCWDHPGPLPFRVFEGLDLGDWLAEAAALLLDEFEDKACIGIKDPRLCMLGTFWKKVLQQAGYAVNWVLVLRHPVESARSQQSRLQRDPSFHFVGGDLIEGVLLWARYMREALQSLHDQSFVLASHDRFLHRPREAFVELTQALELIASPDAATEFGDAFVDPALARHQRKLDESDSAGIRAYAEVYEALAALHGSALLHGNDCVHILSSLSERLAGDTELAAALQRAFVRARHAAVETALELVEAKRILAYQEYALTQAERRVAEMEQCMLATQRQFAVERAKAERLVLENAALRAQQSESAARMPGGKK